MSVPSICSTRVISLNTRGNYPASTEAVIRAEMHDWCTTNGFSSYRPGPGPAWARAFPNRDQDSWQVLWFTSSRNARRFAMALGVTDDYTRPPMVERNTLEHFFTPLQRIEQHALNLHCESWQGSPDARMSEPDKWGDLWCFYDNENDIRRHVQLIVSVLTDIVATHTDLSELRYLHRT